MYKRTNRILAGYYKVIRILDNDFIEFEIICPGNSRNFGKKGVRKVFQNNNNNCVNFNNLLYIEEVYNN